LVIVEISGRAGPNLFGRSAEASTSGDSQANWHYIAPPYKPRREGGLPLGAAAAVSRSQAGHGKVGAYCAENHYWQLAAGGVLPLSCYSWRFGRLELTMRMAGATFCAVNPSSKVMPWPIQTRGITQICHGEIPRPFHSKTIPKTETCRCHSIKRW